MDRTRPIRKPFIVASDKANAFLAQKPDPAVKAKRKELAKIFRENNMKKK